MDRRGNVERLERPGQEVGSQRSTSDRKQTQQKVGKKMKVVGKNVRMRSEGDCDQRPATSTLLPKQFRRYGETVMAEMEKSEKANKKET